jgi:hypothetical protein
MFDVWTILLIAGLGLIAGVLGGMTGIGGSLIMIPGLVVLFGQGVDEPGLRGVHPQMHQHVYQAAAMIVNVFVALPATYRHFKAGAVVRQVLAWMIPTSLAAIFLGVWISNWRLFAPDSDTAGGGPVLLGRLLAAFLLYTAADNLRRMFRKPRSVHDPVDLTHVTPLRCGTVGAATGLVGGLLGLGGGGVAVPMQQWLLKLRLRNCIANSAAAMCITSVFGALYKNASLAGHDANWTSSLLLAALLVPTAMIGGSLGGHLTHTLPVRLVRGIFIALMIAAAWKMAAITG